MDKCDGDGVGRKASPGSSPAATPVGTAFAATAEPVKGEGGGVGGGGAGREHHRLWVRRGRGRAVKPRRGPLSMSGDCGGGAR